MRTTLEPQHSLGPERKSPSLCLKPLVNLRISSFISIANSTHGNNPGTLSFFHAHQKAPSFSAKDGPVALFGITILTTTQELDKRLQQHAKRGEKDTREDSAVMSDFFGTLDPAGILDPAMVLYLLRTLRMISWVTGSSSRQMSGSSITLGRSVCLPFLLLR